MKAIRVSEYGGPSVLKIEAVAAPTPGPGQVLVSGGAT
jgi:NADPH:quinone reductase-like Zn-dependent oxidoreductase